MKEENKTFHCFFEQSGTFKNEFKKLGYKAYDYDILNDFNETDYMIDLFEEIEKGYLGLNSIFDKLESDKDTILAFFPCIRFEDQILLSFRGESSHMKNFSVKRKLEEDIRYHTELNKFYSLITKMAIICIDKKIPLIIENPYSEQHYLRRYWCIKPSVVDMNRQDNGDYFKKPTQYWFINCEPKNNIIFEPLEYVKPETTANPRINGLNRKVSRSMIHPQYANRFIRSFILDEEEVNKHA